jgi:uracil-DNA glycosylase
MADTTFYSLIEDLEKLLLLERDEGVARLEVDRELLESLMLPVHLLAKDAQSGEPVIEVREIPAMDSLGAIAAHVATCRNCSLCTERLKTVPGEGCIDSPDLMFIGEGPGAEEDAQGRPFVGPSGLLLTKMIEAMGYRRDEVFISTVVKCRLPNNRAPLPEEMEACLPYLRQQVALVNPRVIIALGATAVRGLLGRVVAISRVRGNWQQVDGIDIMPTFHPSYLLRDPTKKREVWMDLQEVLKRVGRAMPERGADEKK